MPLPLAFLILVGAAFVGTFIAAHVHRVTGTRLEVAAGSGGALATELGRFSYDPSARQLSIIRSDAVPLVVGVTDGARLYDVTETRDKLLSDLLLDGGVLDLLPAFRDQEFATTLILETDRGKLPILCLTQFRSYDALSPRSDFVLSWLRLFHLDKDIHEVALLRRSEIAEALRAQGLQVSCH